jgi:hypothetical protein
MHPGLSNALAKAQVEEMRRPARTAHDGGLRRVWRLIARTR